MKKQPLCPDCGGPNTGELSVPGKSLCRPCKQHKDREYYRKNRERILKRSAEWAQSHADRRKQYHRAYYEQNADKAKQRSSDWLKANKEKAKAARRDRYARDPQTHKERYQKWADANPEKAKATSANSSHRRRARQRQADIRDIKPNEYVRIFSQGCAFPGCDDMNLELDHIVPLHKGGRHAIGNLQALCKSHNASKGARTWIEFRLMKGVA